MEKHGYLSRWWWILGTACYLAKPYTKKIAPDFSKLSHQTENRILITASVSSGNVQNCSKPDNTIFIHAIPFLVNFQAVISYYYSIWLLLEWFLFPLFFLHSSVDVWKIPPWGIVLNLSFTSWSLCWMLYFTSEYCFRFAELWGSMYSILFSSIEV